MPAYDYICPACSHTFEQTVPTDDRDRVICPECGQPARRKPAAPAVRFLGSGFYSTDTAETKTE